MLDCLRQPGIRECDIDSVLEGAIATYQLEEELKIFKYGIAGLSDLYRATMERHKSQRPEDHNDRRGADWRFSM